MAKTRSSGDKLEHLRAENERLIAENKRLQQKTAPLPQSRWTRTLRTVGAVFFVALAAALLVAGNLLFWAGNTVVKNDRFNETVSPIIREPSVQKAVASYTTAQIYNNVDVTAYVQDALPPKAAFLAPTITSQLRGFTQKTLDKALANPQLQDSLNQVVSRSHARFINTVRQSGGDGVIHLSELYQQLSNSLKGTKLSFLAGKQLPAKVGNIQVVSGSNIKVLHNVIVHIDTWRLLSVLLFMLCAALAVYLARRRRRMVVLLGLYCVLGLFVTLVAVRVTRERIAGQVMPAYADAARQAAQIVLHPLVVQTATLLIAFLLVVLVAWLSGTSHGAVFVQERTRLLFAGKLHHAIFGERENAVTRWIGAHKRLLEWLTVAVVAICMLVARLTPMALLIYAVITVVIILLIELFGAPVQRSNTDVTGASR